MSCDDGIAKVEEYESWKNQERASALALPTATLNCSEGTEADTVLSGAGSS